MAPSRGGGKAGSQVKRTNFRERPTRSAAVATDGIASVYQSMLAEARTDEGQEDRPLKRRKVADKRKPFTDSDIHNSLGTQQSDLLDETGEGSGGVALRAPQTVDESSESDESDESDLGFEDIDINLSAEPTSDAHGAIDDLSIAVEQTSDPKTHLQGRRKPVTGAEKVRRVVVHKLHILCLLAHCLYVNGRCNNATIQQHLAPRLSGKTVSYLNPSPLESQFQRNRSFMDGLQQATDTFVASFATVTSGLHKPHWPLDDSIHPDSDIPSAPFDRADFIEAAKSLTGSQDVGNQLFCAMLRSAGVNARIVCSLQPLPFSNAPKPITPHKPAKEVVFAIASDEAPTPKPATSVDTTVGHSAGSGMVPAARRRLGQPSLLAKVNGTSPVRPPTKRVIQKLAYPVFWVEVLNEAQQKWVSIDPIVTHSINRPSKLEPPSSYALNHLLYVLAFEDDGTARDVTRRYAKAFNAKTRQHRVESSGREGERWWKTVLHFFQRRNRVLDREQVEDTELAQKEAREGMPANVQDFRSHPYYALERHLKRHQVIHPRHEVGKVNVGTAAKPRVESIYRRRDVVDCKSADWWYRLGRMVKHGEQPLKHVPSRSRRQTTPVDAGSGEERASLVGLYSSAQTELYVPPPVQRGRIPKNDYGNLDVYVASMVPAGGEHIRGPLVQRAAQLLRVDYADAVTRFSFKGRKGTAVIDGAVVARQFGDAVRAVIDGFQEQIIDDESRARSLEALKLWRRLLMGLRIHERVKTYGDSVDQDQNPNELSNGDPDTTEHAGVAGGFFPDQSDQPLPTAGHFFIQDLAARSLKKKQRKHMIVEDSDDDDDDPLVTEDDTDRGNNGSHYISTSHDEVAGEGGFLTTDDMGDEESAGGFVWKSASDASHLYDGGRLLMETTERGEAIDDLFGEIATQTTGPRLSDGGLSLPVERHSGATDADLHSDQRPSSSTEMTPDLEKEQQAIMQTVSSQSVSETAMGSVAVAEEEYGQSEESERGSLLSHDPDDDDAEPDWLESD